ncbi:MAG: MBL fold metallo-hydrolase [Acidobacteriia bacterium]|nr:MBL fold metallo-hydrolase [Terriglobia bacterium]
MNITFLGTGTSAGIPVIACPCEVCHSTDTRNRRTRASVLLSWKSKNVLIDTSTDLRAQALREHISHVDAILYTHSHADHILGLDDIRPFNFWQKSAIPMYGRPETLSHIRRAFPYIFESSSALSIIPQVEDFEIDGPFKLFDMDILPVPILHGPNEIIGYRIGRFAYLTDFKSIPPSSVSLLADLDVLVLDALRRRPHPTHSSLDDSIAWARRLKPGRTYFTHMCHDLDHESTEQALPPDIRLAYDGLQIVLES